MRIVLPILLLLATGMAAAVPITYVFEGTFAGGSLDGLPFQDESFILTIQADTDNIESFPEGFSVDNHAVTLQIRGMELEVLSNTITYVNNTVGVVGFGNDDLQLDLLIGPFDSVFSAWDLSSSLGPVTNNAFISEFGTPLAIQGGNLEVADFETILTFTATVEGTSEIPEPATTLTSGAGLALLALYRRRRRAESSV